jgi:hypothetical protein
MHAHPAIQDLIIQQNMTPGIEMSVSLYTGESLLLSQSLFNRHEGRLLELIEQLLLFLLPIELPVSQPGE